MIARLEALLGSEALLRPEAAGTAWRIHGRPAAVVVAPSTTEQAAAVLRIAAEARTPVQPAGAGTWLSGG
ncbi:MAG: FAD-binding protein, partial [Longimicrobiales bacterium]